MFSQSLIEEPVRWTTLLVRITDKPKDLIERYIARFYHVVEDEIVNKATCKVQTVGLKIEFQMKNLADEIYASQF